jgi:hypothetical protein
MVDCPLCLNEFSNADSIYALRCPTPICDFNYCTDCIKGLQKSAADGYSEASDGSKQVKVKIKCPQCREKYQCEKYASEIILQSVVLLRRASHIQDTCLHLSDSEMNATDLIAKHQFVRTTSIEDLQEAVRRLQIYENECFGVSTVPNLEWEQWRTHWPEPGSARPTVTSTVVKGLPWCDPTLFHGLHELMSSDEQEFVTALFTGGQVELLLQAAQILNSVLEKAASRTTSGPPAAALDIATLQKIRKRYRESPPFRRLLPCVHHAHFFHTFLSTTQLSPPACPGV